MAAAAPVHFLKKKKFSFTPSQSTYGSENRPWVRGLIRGDGDPDPYPLISGATGYLGQRIPDWDQDKESLQFNFLYGGSISLLKYIVSALIFFEILTFNYSFAGVFCYP